MSPDVAIPLHGTFYKQTEFLVSGASFLTFQTVEGNTQKNVCVWLLQLCMQKWHYRHRVTCLADTQKHRKDLQDVPISVILCEKNLSTGQVLFHSQPGRLLLRLLPGDLITSHCTLSKQLARDAAWNPEFCILEVLSRSKKFLVQLQNPRFWKCIATISPY